MTGHHFHPMGLVLSLVVAAPWVVWLPPAVTVVAGLFAIAWYAITIWESRTVKRWRRALGWNVPVEDDEI